MTYARQLLKAAGYGICAGVLFGTLMHAAEAKCISNDKWTGKDKQMHLAMGAVPGYLVSAHTGSFRDGFLTGAAVGVGKELLDAAGGGTCSLQDALVTALGGAIGASAGVGISIIRERNAAGHVRTTLVITKEL